MAEKTKKQVDVEKTKKLQMRLINSVDLKEYEKEGWKPTGDKKRGGMIYITKE